MDGQSEEGDLRSALVRLAARLIVEEGLEGESTDALGREYYARTSSTGPPAVRGGWHRKAYENCTNRFRYLCNDDLDGKCDRTGG
jgi:hypothetical protein